jgi:membrane protease YdiL (CAAX protease family)
MWVAAAVALLAVHNVVGNEVLSDAAYVPANLITGGALVGLAFLAGVSFAAIGLDRGDAASGLRWGATIAALVATAIVLGVLLPPTRHFFEDERVSGLSGGGLAYQALVRIPLGTALFEELAFRGVLLALLLRISSTGTAVITSSTLFGLWHVLPTISALRINDLATGTTTRTAAVVAAVVVTGVAGALLCWLRLYTGSLAAPVLVHVATNSFAIVGAFVVQRK